MHGSCTCAHAVQKKTSYVHVSTAILYLYRFAGNCIMYVTYRHTHWCQPAFLVHEPLYTRDSLYVTVHGRERTTNILYYKDYYGLWP